MTKEKKQETNETVSQNPQEKQKTFLTEEMQNDESDQLLAIATAAMQGMLARPTQVQSSRAELAKNAVDYAEALIKEVTKRI